MSEYDNNLSGQQQNGYTPENHSHSEEGSPSEASFRQNAPAQESGAYRYSGSEIPGQNVQYHGQTGQTPSDQNPSANRADYSRSAGFQNPDFRNAGYQNPASGSGSGYGYQNSSTYAQHSGYSQNDNPMAGYNVKPAKTKKKSSGVKGVIAAAVICALLGGIGGGAAVGMALRGGNAQEAESSQSESVQETEPQQEDETDSSASDTGKKTGNINSTVIDVKTNSEASDMTPQSVYEQYVNAVVAVYNEATVNYYGRSATTTSSGSGFIISEDGYIITNNHVVSGAETLTVIMTSGEEYQAELIGTDAENDVALIKIDATGLPTVSIGDSDNIEVGEQVCAIGNPLGELTNTLTVGYVSALDREINENGTPISMFQTDCVINSGNSGGPIFDMHGNVIGITTAKYSSSGNSYTASIEGIGFCIPINDAMDIISDLMEFGYVTGRPSLGITCQVVSSTITQYYHLPAGVTVVEVMEGSAADHAGLEPGDIITAVGGTEVTSITEFRTQLKNYSAGDSAVLTVYRSSTAETMELTVVFDEKNLTPTSDTTQTDPSMNG